MTLLSEFARVTRSRPCPICGRKKYCLVDLANPGAPARVICTKVESAHRWKEAGWLHALKDEPCRRRLFVRTRRVEVRQPAAHDFPALAAQFHAAADAVALSSLCVALGLSAGSLQRLGVGWASREALRRAGTNCGGEGAWSFPMQSAAGEVIGIRLRTVSGYKFAVSGSRQGLFIPTGLDPTDRLLFAEGPTDTAALVDLGSAAVGRPSCTGGTKHVIALVKRLRPREAVVVSDNDEPGMKGAAALASVLRVYLKSVKVIHPRGEFKDARAWTCSSPDQAAITAQVAEAIDTAVPVSALAVVVCKGGR